MALPTIITLSDNTGVKFLCNPEKFAYMVAGIGDSYLAYFSCVDTPARMDAETAAALIRLLRGEKG